MGGLHWELVHGVVPAPAAYIPPMRAQVMVILLTSALGCGGPPLPSPTLEATGAFLFAPITEAQAGGYVVLHNRGEQADTIIGIAADWAEGGMLHESRVEGGRVRMSHLAGLPVPARDSVVLRPGGIHVMLVRLRRMPVEGDTVAWTVRFASGAEVPVLAPVRPYGREP